MLKAFRDNLKYLSWVLWLVIAAFIMVEFVFLGNLGPGGGSQDVAAQVGDQTVTYRDFETAYRRTEDFYRQTYGEQFNSDFAKQLGLHRQVLDTLVADRVLLLEAERLKLQVPDFELQKEILSLPVFQNEDGSFIGKDGYARILRQNGYNQADFEAGLRQDLLLAKVRNLVAANLYVSDAEVEKEYRQRTERAKIRFFLAEYESVADNPQVDEAELATYYEANRESFEIPEQRIVEYLVVDLEKVRAATNVSPEEARAYYDANPAEFDQPEQVQARHILLQVNDDRSAQEAQSQLEDVKRRVLAGEDFAAIAAEISEDPGSKERGGDLGSFGRGAMVEAFETAAFSTAPGQMTGPVQTDFGYHLIQVLGRTEGGPRPFETVEAEISQRLVLERSNEATQAKAEEIAGALESTDRELSTVAESDDSVTYQETPAFAIDDNVPSVGRSTSFAQTAFELAEGEVSEPVRIPRGWAILRPTEIRAPRIPTLDEVRGVAEERFQAELVRQAALERLSRERGDGLDALAEAIGASIEETQSFGSNGPGGKLGGNEEVARAALAADEGEVLGPIATDDGAVMFEIVERIKVDPALFARDQDATRDTLVNQRAGQLVAALVAERREQLDVTFDPQLLATFDLDQSAQETS